MRNMSFMLTVDQAKAKEKDVTRRQAWWRAKPGDMVQQVVKGMGLKKGEKVQKIHVVRLVMLYPEPIHAIQSMPYRNGLYEVEREGFPEWIGKEHLFVEMYCDHNKIEPGDICNRIVFEYVEKENLSDIPTPSREESS